MSLTEITCNTAYTSIHTDNGIVNGVSYSEMLNEVMDIFHQLIRPLSGIMIVKIAAVFRAPSGEIYSTLFPVGLHKHSFMGALNINTCSPLGLISPRNTSAPMFDFSVTHPSMANKTTGIGDSWHLDFGAALQGISPPPIPSLRASNLRAEVPTNLHACVSSQTGGKRINKL